ncbi:GNAT family N-acetyltransferase [Pontibacillus halophilus]
MMNIIEATSKAQIEDAYAIRRDVFVNEQGVSLDEEMDEHDDSATHLVGYLEDEAVAASRLRFVDKYGKFERISVLSSKRGKSFGKQMIEAMETITRNRGYHYAKLNAQVQALGFYQSLGYEVVSDEFLDAGIPHVTMTKALA